MGNYDEYIVVGSDHAGVLLKKQIVSYLRQKGMQVEDVGAFSEESVDYPDYAKVVAERIKNGKASKGILVCWTGIGISIAANKIPGVRAAACTDERTAKLSREHNDSNILAIGSSVVGDKALDIVDTWLEAKFEGGRHANRLDKIKQIEAEMFKSSKLRPEMFSKKVFIFDHPLIQHKVSLLRDKHTTTKEFRELVSEISMLMAYEVTRELPLKEVEIQTPVGIAKTNLISGRKIGIVPILRAGLGMVDGMLKIIPMVKVGHIGLYRDPESLNPVEYYCKLPRDAADRNIVMLDPMLATGGSAAAAIKFVKAKGINNIRLMCIIAAKAGVERIINEHPDVEIYCAAVDDVLNEHGYIVPGLGDAGDRLFGTK